MSTENLHLKQFQANGERLALSPNKQSKKYFEDKPLPLPDGTSIDEDSFVNEFTRNDLRELIHSITQELKLKATKTPLVFLAFRPKIDDSKLSDFLSSTLPTGSRPASPSVIERTVQAADEFTLVVALKYLWARLPLNSIIGWDAYDSFRKLEEKENYPKRAFLDYMPQCLSSPSHASIVYDFLDLIVSIAANAKENQMSGRKIAKMAGIWAFHGPPNAADLTKSRLDPTENTFKDGLVDWLPAANAMFHLLLSFLRSMLPEDHSTKLQLPRTLQALLASNSYPPPDVTFSSSTLVTVPLVTIKSNVLSNSPIDLLNRIPKVLSFKNPDLFEAKEDYALLKSLCKGDENIINKLSMESKRIIQLMSKKPNDTKLKAGWPIVNQNPKAKADDKIVVTVSRVSIDDYFIWTWLASMSFEETSSKKRLFGRSLISEIVFDGFKKWIIVEEQNNHSNVRNHRPPLPEKPKVRKVSQTQYKSLLDDLPESPPTKKDKSQKTKPKPLRESSTVNSMPVEDTTQRVASSGSSKLNFFKPLKKNLQQQYQQYQQQLHNQHRQPSEPSQGQGQQPNSSYFPQPSSQKFETPASKVIQPYQNSAISSIPTFEPVALPEIETNQYRLSIPLDSFGFDEYDSNLNNHEYQRPKYDDYQQPKYDEYQEPVSHGLQPGTESFEYHSLAPQNREAVPHTVYQQPYQYWSSKGPEDNSLEEQHLQSPLHTSSYISEPQLQSNGPIAQHPQESSNIIPASNPALQIPYSADSRDVIYPTEDTYTAPISPYREASYRNSIENLRDMVDEMTVQVNSVENKLDIEKQKLRPMYEVSIPHPDQLGSELLYSEDGLNISKDIGTVPQTLEEHKEKSKGHRTSYMEYPGQQEQMHNSKNDASHLNPTKPKLEPIVTQSEKLTKPRRKPPATFGSVDTTSGDTGSSTYGPTPEVSANPNTGTFPKHISLADEEQTNFDNSHGSNQDSNYQSNGVTDEQRSQRDSYTLKPRTSTVFSDTTEKESFYSVQTNEQYVREDTGVPRPHGNVEDRVKANRHSATSQTTNRYPESIIDTYRQPSLYHSDNSSSQNTPARNLNSSPGSKRHSDQLHDDQQNTLKLSVSDAHYIPESAIPDGPIPQPKPPRSPIAKNTKSPRPTSHVEYSSIERADSDNMKSVPELPREVNKETSIPQLQYIESNPEKPLPNQNLQPQHYSGIAPTSSQSLSPQRQAPAMQTEVHERYTRSDSQHPPRLNQVTPRAAHNHQNDSDRISTRTSQGTFGEPNHPSSTPQGPGKSSDGSNSRYGSPYHHISNQNTPQKQSITHNNDGSSERFRGSATSLQVPLEQARTARSSPQRGPSPQHSKYQQSPGPGYRGRSHSQNMTQVHSSSPRGNERPNSSKTSSHTSHQGHHGYSHHGYTPQGYPPQGYPQQGYPPQGHYPQGYSTQGYPPQSYPPQGYLPQGYPPQGYPPQGYPSQAYPPQNYSASNYTSQGPPGDANSMNYPPQDHTPQGYPSQNHTPQGYSPAKGYPSQGYPSQGHTKHGQPPVQGYPAQGWHPPPGNQKLTAKSSASDFTITSLPPATSTGKLHGRANNANKKDMRAALIQGDFGI